MHVCAHMHACAGARGRLRVRAYACACACVRVCARACMFVRGLVGVCGRARAWACVRVAGGLSCGGMSMLGVELLDGADRVGLDAGPDGPDEPEVDGMRPPHKKPCLTRV